VPIKVEAEGSFRSRPDVMTVTAGVVTSGRTARGALTANSDLANRLVQAVRAQGIAAEDVRTSELTVDPVTDEEERSDKSVNRRSPATLPKIPWS